MVGTQNDSIGAATTPTFYNLTIDPRTGRTPGDHGTANQALEFALDHSDGDLGNMEAFLRAWREGDAAEEWPEFYDWLRSQEGGIFASAN